MASLLRLVVPGISMVLVVSLAARAGGAAPDSKDTRRDLKRALVSGDTKAVDESVAELAKAGGAGNMKVVLDVLEKMPASEDSLYWSLIAGAVTFVDKPAVEELGKLLVRYRTQALTRDILYAYAKNESIHAVTALKPLLKDAPDDVKQLAARKVCRVRTHDAVEALIGLLKDEMGPKSDKPSVLALTAAEGLMAITGQKFGPNVLNWEGWWEKNKSKPLPTLKDLESGSGSATAVDIAKLSPDRERKEAVIGLEEAPPKGVVVLSADFTKKKLPTPRDLNNDHIEKALEDLHIPHVVVRREDFAAYDLSQTGALVINCAQFHTFCICPTCVPSGKQNNRLRSCSNCNKHIEVNGGLTGGDVKKIAEFQARGGFVFCEDWIVKEVVDKAWPKYVAAGDKDKIWSDTLVKEPVEVVPARGMGTHPYLRGIFEPKFVVPPSVVAAAESIREDGDEPGDDPKEKEGATGVAKDPQDPPPTPDAPEAPKPVKIKHSWTIDLESFAFKVQDKSKVVTLLSSGQIQKEMGGEGAVAVAFRPGSGPPPGTKGVARGTPGVVVVVLSHFGHQHSSEDELSIQNLLLNFLIDANAARETRAPKRSPDAEKKEAAKKAAGKAKDGEGEAKKS